MDDRPAPGEGATTGASRRPSLVLGLANYAPTDPGDWGHLTDLAVAAEEAGFDRVVVSDHVAFGDSIDDYGRPELGGVAGGRQPTGPDGHWLEPLTVLTWLAARTEAIGLGTNILLAALRRPVVLAKVVATLDVLSGGRVDLGVGVGWQRAEYEAAGLDFVRRGRLLDHTLEVCASLWRGAVTDYDAPELTFERVIARPAPCRPGGPPVWISGSLNPHVVRRIARFGSGWIPWGEDAADLPTSVPRMRELVHAEGRDPGHLGVFRYLPLAAGRAGRADLAATFAPVPGDLAVGVTDFRVPADAPGGTVSIRGRFDEVVDAFRSSVS